MRSPTLLDNVTEFFQLALCPKECTKLMNESVRHLTEYTMIPTRFFVNFLAFLS
jgi:hypothetical protein